MKTDNDGEKPLEGLEEFYATFLRDRMNEIPQLSLWLSSKSYHEIGQLAHRWKGFSRPYGFARLEELSIDLENLAKQGKQAECEKVFSQIQEYLNSKAKKMPS